MPPETKDNTPVQQTRPRRWIRFRLRTLLIMAMLLSVPLGFVSWELDQRRREKAAIVWIEESNGWVDFLELGNEQKSWWQKRKDYWFGNRVLLVFLPESRTSDISLLAELKYLEQLSICYTKVSDLSPLTKLKNLEHLIASHTRVSDLSPLAELKDLKALELDFTQVSDLSPLAKLKNLEYLFVSNTQVSDISPLAALKNLKALWLSNTQVSEKSVRELQRALPNCKIIHF